MDEAWNWLAESSDGEAETAPSAGRVPQEDGAKAQVSAQSRPIIAGSYVWPAEVSYAKRSDWSGLSEAEVALHHHARLPGVQVRWIRGNTHPCRGERGLFATKRWNTYDVIGEYTGIVSSAEQAVEDDIKGEQEEDYRLAVSKCCATSPFINARTAGNETRFINDFRGVAARPNCTFSEACIGGLPTVLVLVTERVEEEEELLADYGEQYWTKTAETISVVSNE